MKDRIFLSLPHMSDEGYEMQYVKEDFDTNWIAPLGENVNGFERELAEKVGSKAAAALFSGTAAIHLALKAAGVVINCYNKIGRGYIINTVSTIDHDNCIDDFVHISPESHLAGTVNVEKGTWLGIGSVVSNNITITNGCKVDAGSVVVKDINEPGVYVGVPVRRVKL